MGILGLYIMIMNFIIIKCKNENDHLDWHTVKLYSNACFNPLIHGREADLPPIALQAKNLKIYKVSKNWKNKVSLFLDLSFLSL